MPNGLIVLLVIVGISVAISVLSNWLKSQQQTEQAKQAERRSVRRTAEPDPFEPMRPKPGKPAGTDIDRFLEEIDKLRKRSAGEPATAKPTVAKPVVARPMKTGPAPTIEPTKRKRAVAESAAVPTVPVVAPRRADPVSTSPVVTRPAQLAALAQPGRPSVTAPSRLTPKTEFAAQLSGLLQGKNALQLAVVLQEVLGPPKCRRG